MKIRSSLLCIGILMLTACSWMPYFGKHKQTTPQTLMKSLTGEVDYSLTHSLPADAYLEVTLSDVSKQDAPARTIASDRIKPVGSSPVSFVLSYEPSSLEDGVDFAVSASIRQQDRILAKNDTQITVLGRSGNEGPVRIVMTEIY